MVVTVYCLVFNHEKYIRNALDGFVNQKTNFDFQVIVHDDCSTDNSALIIKDYAEKYPNIIKPIFQHENQYSKGKDIKREFIFPLVQGEYIAVCEGDDYWCDETKLQKQVDFLENNPEYIACAHDTEIIEMSSGKKRRMFNNDEDHDISLENIVSGNFFHISSVMYRSKVINTFPPFFEKAKSFGDVPLALNLYINGRIRYLGKVMSVYRHGTQGSWSYRNEYDMHSRVNSYQQYIDMLKSFNDYTCFKYNEIIKYYINKYEINKISFSDDYQVLKEKEYVEIFKTLSLREQCVIIYRTMFRRIYKHRMNHNRHKLKTN